MIKKFGDGRDWFFESKLGMFVHWGLYALPAWHEQILWRGKMPRKDYEPLMNEFNPVKYDPDEWLDLMEAAGMDYIVFTTKHHDGFCMYDTKYTDYNIMNTPYGRDVLKMLAKACERRNIKLGLYYSLPDWNHPNYPNYGRHHEMFGQRDGEEPDEVKYMEFVKNQVRELCTNYGKIWQFFWDVNVGEFYYPDINEMLRELQPDMVINDRGPSEGDYATPERRVPDGMAFQTPTQACQALGRESWGWREGEDYYTPKYMMQSIDKILCMGGSYLLNMGPCADGSIAPVYKDSFAKIGDWYKKIYEAFDGTYPASYMLGEVSMLVSGHQVNRDMVLMTRVNNTVYVHIYQEPQTCGLVLKPIDFMPESVTLLNDGSDVEFDVELMPWCWQDKPYLHIKNMPVDKFSGEVMILKIEFGTAASE